MSTKINVELFCATCGQSDFEHNEDKSWIKCNNCNREYTGGVDELLEYNQNQVDAALEQEAQKLLDVFAKDMETKYKNNKHIKFKK